ncbi:MAG: dienelactone hydrolase family protein [Elusimicrobia bacterium]|nr:dienelactone hydrolase family protein [Elusimicrobiota bacterium]
MSKIYPSGWSRVSKHTIKSIMPSPPILPSTKASEWPKIRKTIEERISESMGKVPAGICRKPEYKEIKRYEEYGLTHIVYKYRVIEDEWNEAVVLLPKGGEKVLPAHAVIAIHGNNMGGKYCLMDPKNYPESVYALELAERGYVVILPDQYSYSPEFKERDLYEVQNEFYKKYPEWTLDSRRLIEQQLSLDMLEKLGFSKGKNIGCFGHSLGGRAALILPAFDERVIATVSSAGITPNSLYLYKIVAPHPECNPRIIDYMKKNCGIPQWEYNELISLIAPKALLEIETYFDPCASPDVMNAFSCVYAAFPVYKLLGANDKLAIYVHGDGHITFKCTREMSWNFLDEYLKISK